ncbi:hypothetical protein LTR84_012437 [Exophiala bonariae]|uniref:Uncharacterized protein n=1 Tax=Exophiala bonariae TaxID=1690606 RepID=A0AAV9MRH5_9EURO|nr:hypothetical protein LTR84_012437 [Exophiala bonariae]
MQRKSIPGTLLMLLAILLLVTGTFARSWRAGDECPSTIKVSIPGGRYYRDDEPKKPLLDTMASVHAALTTCPNITSLDLRVSLQGCSNWPDRWSFPFSLPGGETYPALRQIRLEGYRFDDRPVDETGWPKGSYLPWYEKSLDWVFSGNAMRALRYHMLPREQREKNNIQLWLDAMDWSQVEEFAFLGHQQPDTVSALLNSTQGVMPGLRRVELGRGQPWSTLQFLLNVERHSLTHLTSIDSFNRKTPFALREVQGDSLQHIDLHTVETTLVESPAYTATELEHFKHMPNLTHLSLNIARNGTWLFEELSAISQIPSLRTAELWLDITSMCRKQKVDNGHYNVEDPNCKGRDQYLLPYINETSTLEVFKFLRAKKIGEELTNVTFWGGDWSRPWDGPVYSPPWIEGRKVKVLCTNGKEEHGSGEENCTVLTGVEYWDQKARWYEDVDEMWLNDSEQFY